MRRLALLIAGLALIPVPIARTQNAPADVKLEWKSGSTARLPLRCEPFAPVGDRDARTTSVQGDEVLAADLANSAVFQVAKSWDPNSSGSAPQFVTGGKWTVRGTQLKLAGELRDFPGRRPLLVKEYAGPVAEWRKLVHRFADDIVLQLTGEIGVAGTRLAFVSRSGRDMELCVMDFDGHGLTQLTTDHSIARSPNWSPDGSLLVFTSYRGGKGPQLWVMNPANRKPFLLSGRNGINTSGIYSPDGQRIACTLSMDGNSEIYVLDARGGAPSRLTNNRSVDTSPCWSPTGREIAFTSGRSGNPQIYVMDSDGGNPRRLTYDVDYTDSPMWSPKGDRIAFVSRTGAGFDLFICRADGSSAQRVVSGGSNENPHWAPDGRHLVFSSNREGALALYVTDLDGTPPRRLETGGRKALSPAWSPRP
ncbi:MAG: Tol-Pal system beta propeller repeat protein TolB [Candidatus Eisenbacteria bacterium]